MRGFEETLITLKTHWILENPFSYIYGFNSGYPTIKQRRQASNRCGVWCWGFQRLPTCRRTSHCGCRVGFQQKWMVHHFFGRSSGCHGDNDENIGIWMGSGLLESTESEDFSIQLWPMANIGHEDVNQWHNEWMAVTSTRHFSMTLLFYPKCLMAGKSPHSPANDLHQRVYLK